MAQIVKDKVNNLRQIEERKFGVCFFSKRQKLSLTKFCVFLASILFSSAITDSHEIQKQWIGGSIVAFDMQINFSPQPCISLRLYTCLISHFPLMCKALFSIYLYIQLEAEQELQPILAFISHQKIHISNWPMFHKAKSLDCSPLLAFCLWGNDC